MKKFSILFFGMLAAWACQKSSPIIAVETGLEVLVRNHFEPLTGKRVGVITNHTGLTKDGRHIIDLIASAPGVQLTAIFGPEHGVRGVEADGSEVTSSRDSASGAPIYSLYGKHKQPTKEMLENVDALVFDIQDVGARFYTYISTMALSMEAAAAHGKTFVVLDRPNPITGAKVEGPMLLPGFESFVGMYPLPIRHGMTAGELARMFKGERWIAGADSLDLLVVEMIGWRRRAWLDQTDVPWTPPSPSMRTLATAAVYPGTCLIEGTNVSEGRGADHPFEQIGAPWIDGSQLAEELHKLGLPGVTFEPVQFTPVPRPPSVLQPKFENETCGGVFLRVSNRDVFEPVKTGVALICTIKKLYPEKLLWTRTIDRLYGSDRLRLAVDANQSFAEILSSYENEGTGFMAIREKYLLYE